MVPLGAAEDWYAAAIAPFGLEPCYQTPAARRIGLFGSAKEFTSRLSVSRELLTLGKMMSAYEHILHHWLEIKTELRYPLRLTMPGDDGLERHLALHFDPRFVALKVADDFEPPPPRDVLERIIAEPTNLDLWTATLPPEKFSFEGFTVVTASDVTTQTAMSRLKNDLIAKDAMSSVAKVDHLQNGLRSLLRRPDLQLGLIGFHRQRAMEGSGGSRDVEAIQSARPVGRSLLLCDETVPVCPNRSDSWYAEAFHGRDPVIVYDLEGASHSGYEAHLLERGHRNLLVYPLHVDDEVVGLLELSSPHPGDLNAFNALLLVDVVPLFATAMARSQEELEDRVQAVIKEQYTAIHPSVEWRFREAALSRIETVEHTGETPELEQIVFADVYPLYGLADIRGSSNLRNSAIAADLTDQLRLAADVVTAAGVARPLPALEEIGYRIAGYRERLESGLRSDDESSVLELLEHDVEPLFDQVGSYGSEVRERVDAYRAQLDPKLGVLYRRRRDFEESVTLINETVSRVLDEEQVRGQAIFPHYFEKFKTDGVDYSIYLGAALQPDGGFDPLYLRSLRIWQLMLSCKLSREVARVRDQAPVPLDVTQLVLVQDHPLSIRFRVDEKQFDVDGAYNIRYEIVKKRIDKARIQGTSERATAPGKLVVVYSTSREAQEYRRYLEFLMNRGHFDGVIEELELEDLQGISGLKALRIGIAQENEDAKPSRLAPAEVLRLARA